MMLDLERVFATPLIITSEMSEADFRLELAKMQLRSQATREFIEGTLHPLDFMEALNQSGVDVDTAIADWGNGISYLG